MPKHAAVDAGFGVCEGWQQEKTFDAGTAQLAGWRFRKSIRGVIAAKREAEAHVGPAVADILKACGERGDGPSSPSPRNSTVSS